jgi:phage tail tape-measure protein
MEQEPKKDHTVAKGVGIGAGLGGLGALLLGGPVGILGGAVIGGALGGATGEIVKSEHPPPYRYK